MSLPLFFTVTRMFLGPVFFFFYIYSSSLGLNPEVTPYILLSLLGYIELSDILDGFLARRFNQVTDIGKVLDPLADSLTRNAIFLTFTAGPIHLPLFIVLLFLYRDLLVGGLRTLLALSGIPLAARTSGKIKAVLQATASLSMVCLLIAHTKGFLSQSLLTTFCSYIGAFTAFYSVASGCEYFFAHKQFLKLVLKK